MLLIINLLFNALYLQVMPQYRIFICSVYYLIANRKSHLLYDQQPIRFHLQGPIWRDFHTRFGSALPTANREWLLDSGSLTQRLIKSSHHQFSVHILSQQWGSAQLSEYNLLGVAPRHCCLIREVLLLCDQQPWVYARSVLPASSLTGELRHLRHFDNRPLGQLLFNTPGMHRSPFQIAQLSMSDLPLQAKPLIDNNNKAANLWGRRSRFVIYNKPLLVSEIFLPDFHP